MKATLEFNLPEDNYDFKSACKAAEMASSLFAMDNDMRGKIKHSDLPQDFKDILQDYRTEIAEALKGIEV
jgi:hypothetical protein